MLALTTPLAKIFRGLSLHKRVRRSARRWGFARRPPGIAIDEIDDGTGGEEAFRSLRPPLVKKGS